MEEKYFLSGENMEEKSLFEWKIGKKRFFGKYG